MDEFLACLAKLGIVLFVVLIILLLLIGGLLIWNPAALLNVLRYGIAGVCLICGGIWLVQLLVGLCRRR